MRLARAVLAAVTVLAVSACTPSAPPPAPSPAVSTAPTAASEIPEPTTTNTLPPPPAPTAAPASTAGRLSAASLPVPAGWQTKALPSSDEDGTRSNGTWVHERDARYAALDVITLGCADVTRDDFTDPTTALEGNYVSADDEPGVGLVLDFANEVAATRYFGLLQAQVQACTTTDDPLRTTVVTNEADELIDQRTYADSQWIEVARRHGTAVTLIILSDPGHAFPQSAARALLDQIGR